VASISTLTSPRRGTRSRIVSYLSWAVLIVAASWFYRIAVARYTHLDAAHYGLHWKTRWWLVAHLGGGSLALLLGPFQFIRKLRTQYPQIHRWMGRTYLAGILVASIAAIYMCIYVTPIPGFGVSLFFLDVAWLTTSSMALLAALCRQFAVHREWMIRSYVVTFGFVVFRLVQVINPFHLPNGINAVTNGWLCWAVPLLFAEVTLQWRRTVGPLAKNAERVQ
jgi:uncharacterized membrane protein